MHDCSTHLREAGVAEVVVVDRLSVADAVDGRGTALVATACRRGLSRRAPPVAMRRREITTGVAVTGRGKLPTCIQRAVVAARRLGPAPLPRTPFPPLPAAARVRELNMEALGQDSDCSGSVDEALAVTTLVGLNPR
jgi:hypothetical protein